MTTPTRQPRREDPVVVTSAYQSRGDELDARKKRYVYAMSGRVVLFTVSVLFFRSHLWVLVPAMVLSMVLPYVAVVLANGGRKRPEMAERYIHRHDAVPALPPSRTIDAD